ncbi:hypothetical protein E3N88_41684 [Mikania micrantha]|uniref:Germin-like protein n=1 Tax=Mikania micrantha TaxID=192012 RepID=A0A5N6LJX8_9ASTR|nr:hypothetical protein E3N88_41684 [Mikania micrantha]
MLVNGFACKDAKLVQANDFFFSGLHLMGNTSNAVGSRVTPVTVAQLPGLNTLGISMARIDFAPWGINPPHTHPRATEILTVIEGSIQVGFVTSNPEVRLISKVLAKGDVFVFPEGLVHFQKNVGYGNAVAIVGLSSQNPGVIIEINSHSLHAWIPLSGLCVVYAVKPTVITVANAVFGAKPDIPNDLLAKAFQVDVKGTYGRQWRIQKYCIFPVGAFPPSKEGIDPPVTVVEVGRVVAEGRIGVRRL